MFLKVKMHQVRNACNFKAYEARSKELQLFLEVINQELRHLDIEQQ